LRKTLLKAATSIGRIVGSDGIERPREIFALQFYGEKIAIMVTIGTNGYIVGANPSSLRRLIRDEDPLVENLPVWPVDSVVMETGGGVEDGVVVETSVDL
jgi:hypothetical protein